VELAEAIRNQSVVKMSSRSEKAMFKAEQIFKESKKAYENAHTDETASWVLVFDYQKKWAETYSNDKFGFWKIRAHKSLYESAVTSNIKRMAALKKLHKDQVFFELKQRQWQDFLVRDEKRIKHCSCGERDNSAMVQCDDCFHWVHLSCANLTEEQAQEAEGYCCASCCLAEIKAFAEAFICHEGGEIDDDGVSVASSEE
jgi:hypothetical protein